MDCTVTTWQDVAYVASLLVGVAICIVAVAWAARRR